MKKLSSNLFKYIIFVLPLIILFKALYHCILSDNWTLSYVYQHFISNVPFVGQMLIDYFWKGTYLLSIDSIKNHQNTMEFIFIGGLGGCLGRSIADTYFSEFLKLPMSIDGNGTKTPSNILMVKGSNLGTGSTSGTGSSIGQILTESELTPSQINNILENMRTSTKDYKEANQAWIKKVQDLKRIFSEAESRGEMLDLNSSGSRDYMARILHRHLQALTGSIQNRIVWMENLETTGIKLGYKEELGKIQENILEIRMKFSDKIEELISQGKKDKSFLIQMFNESNAFRNKVYSELNKAENVFNLNFKESMLYKNVELKKMIHKDYVEEKKSFANEDGYLRKRISEVLNERK